MTLGMVAQQPILHQTSVLAASGLFMTGLIYGCVAGIVRMDDAGLYLARKEGPGLCRSVMRSLGRGMEASVPHFMKALNVAGTAAMFAVGGSMFLHGIPVADRFIEMAAHSGSAMLALGATGTDILSWGLGGLGGLLGGTIALVTVRAAAPFISSVIQTVGLNRLEKIYNEVCNKGKVLIHDLRQKNQAPSVAAEPEQYPLPDISSIPAPVTRPQSARLPVISAGEDFDKAAIADKPANTNADRGQSAGLSRPARTGTTEPCSRRF